MPKRFDATVKDLAAFDPVGFLSEIDAPPTQPVRLLNADLSTVTTATDIVFGLGDPLSEVLHVDAQAGADVAKQRDLLVYNALLHRQYCVPVHSILLLLRREAQHGIQSGNLSYAARPGKGKMDFSYEVVRLWERPAEVLLARGLGTLPLAALGRLPERMSLEEGMHWVLTQVVDRLDQQGDSGLVRRLFAATFVLNHLRLDQKQVQALFEGVYAMRESISLQAALDEGVEKGVEKGIVQGEQRALLRQGRKKFGEPDDSVRLALANINDLDRLDRLSERMLDVASWQELLETP